MQNSSVGAHIREHREKAGLTQAQLAEAVFATRQTVGNWSAGQPCRIFRACSFWRASLA